MSSVRVTSCRRAGRLIPRREQGLRAAVVILAPGAQMDWHSTGVREELLLVLTGRVQLDVRTTSGRLLRHGLPEGHSAHLAVGTLHRLVNPSGRRARYIYVTG